MSWLKYALLWLCARKYNICWYHLIPKREVSDPYGTYHICDTCNNQLDQEYVEQKERRKKEAELVAQSIIGEIRRMRGN